MISLRLSRVACSVEIVRNGYGARINRTNARRAAQWQKLRQHFPESGHCLMLSACRKRANTVQNSFSIIGQKLSGPWVRRSDECVRDPWSNGEFIGEFGN